MDCIKQEVIDAVLEYYRSPFLFELRLCWENSYRSYPLTWPDLFDKKELNSFPKDH